MSSADVDEVSPYELLGLSLEATDAEIRTAYRQRSLKVHPDRNRGNPDAARKFHELNQAYELLLDPLRRMALDAKQRVKEARKARFASYDAKRKGLVEELEASERAFKKAKLEKEGEERARWLENERIMDEGRRLREERERALRKREEELLTAEKANASENEPPAVGTLDTTVRLKYQLPAHPELTTPSALSTLLSPFGSVDDSAIVISLKPSPPKKPKRVTALVAFKQIGGAFAAVCSSGRSENGLTGIEVDWAEGKEPELIGWLIKMGKLAPPSSRSAQSPPSANQRQDAPSSTTAASAPLFSSFPSTFPDLYALPNASAATPAVPGLDYESLTLMRLRQAERTRMEKEIREREAAEE